MTTISDTPTRERPGPTAGLRAATVVSGGPTLLGAASVLAPVAAALRWPSRASRPAVRRGAWAATATGVVAPWVYAATVRPQLLVWGSTPEEQARRLPGDGSREPLARNTRAVTVHAPAAEVWRWLVQIGQDRGGFYSYDWLENLAGCHLHSAEEIREDLQDLEPGDRLSLMPGVSTRIAEVDPPRSLVIENWGAYVIEPIDDVSCRLIARSHVDPTPAAVGYLAFLELPHAIMERRMLLGIKERAERTSRYVPHTAPA